MNHDFDRRELIRRALEQQPAAYAPTVSRLPITAASRSAIAFFIMVTSVLDFSFSLLKKFYRRGLYYACCGDILQPKVDFYKSPFLFLPF